jgi:hypothetical protein
MASTETGELFTEEQYRVMSEEKRTELKIVGLTPEESAMLSCMNRKQRRDWLRKNKKFSRRQRNVQSTQAR